MILDRVSAMISEKTLHPGDQADDSGIRKGESIEDEP
jgi:hypothetical protein